MQHEDRRICADRALRSEWPESVWTRAGLALHGSRTRSCALGPTRALVPGRARRRGPRCSRWTDRPSDASGRSCCASIPGTSARDPSRALERARRRSMERRRLGCSIARAPLLDERQGLRCLAQPETGGRSRRAVGSTRAHSVGAVCDVPSLGATCRAGGRGLPTSGSHAASAVRHGGQGCTSMAPSDDNGGGTPSCLELHRRPKSRQRCRGPCRIGGSDFEPLCLANSGRETIAPRHR